MGEQISIDDIANLRAIPTAVPANPGSIAIENVAGTLKQVTDQGVVTPLGSEGGNASAPISGDGTLGDPFTIEDDAIALSKLENAGAAGVVGALGAGAWSGLTNAELTTLVNPATASLPGALSAADFSKLIQLYRGAGGIILGDADTTITPIADKYGLYVLPPATLTANRVLTVTNASGPLTLTVRIIRFDNTANTYTVRNNTPTVLHTFAASPGLPANRGNLLVIYLNGGTTWAYSEQQYVRAD